MLQWEKVLKSIRIWKWIPKKLELITRSSSTGSAGRTEGEKRNWTEQYYFLI